MSIIGPQVFASLIAREPLIGHFLMNSKIIESKHLPGNACAAIAVNENKMVLFLNTERFPLLNDMEKAAVIIHEYLHPLMGHLTTRIPGSEGFTAMVNVAQDLAINQLIIRSGLKLPSYAVSLTTGEYNLLPFKSAEYYYRELLKDIPKFEKHFGALNNQEDQIDYHGDWEKNNKETKKVIDRLGKQYAAGTNPSIGNALAGTEYANLIENIKAQNKSNIKWITQIAHLVHNIIEDEKNINYKRESRRYEEEPFIFPGSKKNKRTKAAVIVDVSGSMYRVMSNCLSEINKLSTIIDIDVYMCDLKITKIIKGYRKNAEMNINGFGGTKLQPAFDQAILDEAEIIICLTDGYLADEQIETENAEMIWVIYNNPTFLPSNGTVIRVDI